MQKIKNFTYKNYSQNTVINKKMSFSASSSKICENAQELDSRLKLAGLDISKININIEDKAKEKLTEWYEQANLFDGIKQMLRKFSTENIKIFHKLIVSGFAGKYRNFLFDQRTHIGEANSETKRIFTSEGLNFSHWMGFKDKQEFFHDRVPHELSLWTRKPNRDLYIGNRVKSCIGTNRENSAVIVGGLLNTNVQYILSRRTSDKKINDYSRIFILKSQNTGEKHMYMEYRHGEIGLREFVRFVKKFSQAVIPDAKDILIKKRLLIDVDMANLWHKDESFEILGKTVPDTKLFPDFNSVTGMYEHGLELHTDKII